ncbi:MAG: PVC-type heme-binding CxxCH protein [Verrucomicrobiota bacterium]
MKVLLTAALLLAASFAAPAQQPQPAPADRFDPSLKEFVEKFKGRGALEDSSKPLTPEETIKHFKVADGLVMEVVGAEPIIRQPLNLHFDERGRMWVVQYLQYPFPAGLKIIKYDQYIRAVFDKVPPPPPNHFKGADKISIHEDTDGDGFFDQHKEFLSDLNICSSVTTGRGGVWVLNPPYLLFYPDQNRDDIPDGPPVVHLSGFGLEDTHSVASSLNWGPDGWLYGANGSTTTGLVKGVRWLGQCIWRYHPETGEFEIFAEGGGNTFSMDFDSKGRAYSGTNHGNTRGMHYPQGGAGIKNWGKHGPLMNPYSFGFFEHMAHKGFEPRFAQSMVIYEGGAIPRLEGRIIASMSLMNRVMASDLLRDTSTYQTIDLDPLILTDDRWFRPVDTEVGPDGAIYLADWYDSRLTHVDPRDTWDRVHGRVYRLKAQGAKPMKPFDLAKQSSAELIKVLSHPNEWFRNTAIRLFADRKDKSVIPALKQLVETEKGQLALEAFWALNLSGGFDEAVAVKTLNHPNEKIREWTIRLIGDTKKISPPIASRLVTLARDEKDVQVRSQLASSCERWPGPAVLPIVRELILRNEDVDDRHVPLLIWWAVESKAVSDRQLLLEKLKESALWQAPIFARYITARLGQRYTAERNEQNLRTAAQLLAMAPTPQDVDALVRGMEAGLQGDVVKAVPAELLARVEEVWKSRPHNATLIGFALRLGYEPAGKAALQLVADTKTSAAEKKKYLEMLSERRMESAVPVILDLLRNERNEALRIDLLNALQRFANAEIGRAILELFPKFSARLRATAQTVLASRPDWSLWLLEAVDKTAIKPEQITIATVTAIQNHKVAAADTLIKKHWGRLRQSDAEKNEKIASVRRLLAKGKGDAAQGRPTFMLICGTCHKLNNEGATIGPELTGYERDNLDFMLPAIIDPSLGVREEYTAFNVTTKDGQQLLGFLDENTPQSITLRDLTNNKIKIAREDVKTLEASHTSVMPDGLLDALNDQQIRDLFAYLTRKN